MKKTHNRTRTSGTSRRRESFISALCRASFTAGITALYGCAGNAYTALLTGDVQTLRLSIAGFLAMLVISWLQWRLGLSGSERK